MTITRLQLKFIKASVGGDMSIPSAGAQLAIHALDALRTVATAHVHFALEVADLNLAVAGVQIDFAFSGHVNIDVYTVIANIEGHAVMGIANSNLDRVAILMSLYLEPALADFVAGADHSGFDSVLVPGINVDVRVRSFHPEVRPAGNVVGL